MLPFRPTRGWRYNSGPRLPNEIADEHQRRDRSRARRAPHERERRCRAAASRARTRRRAPRRCRTAATRARARRSAACRATARRTATACGCASPSLVQRCRLQHDVIVALRGAAQHHDRGCRLTHQCRAAGAACAVRSDTASTGVSQPTTIAGRSGRARESCLQRRSRRPSATTSTRSRSPARASASPDERGAQDVPRHERSLRCRARRTAAAARRRRRAGRRDMTGGAASVASERREQRALAECAVAREGRRCTRRDTGARCSRATRRIGDEPDHE